MFRLAVLIEKGDKNHLYETVAVGKKLNGVIGYGVSTDQKILEVRFAPDFWRGDDTVFAANK